LTILDTRRSKHFRGIGHLLIYFRKYTADSYGSSSAVPIITVDADGRITAASTGAVRGGLSTAHLAAAVKLDPGLEEQAARERQREVREGQRHGGRQDQDGHGEPRAPPRLNALVAADLA
jgi:hypothetical protein